MDSADSKNPMSGYKRCDSQPISRKTGAYSFVDPDKIINVGPQVEPTIEMHAVETKPLTVKEVISFIIEVDVSAWKALPSSVKNAIIDRPSDFQLIPIHNSNVLNKNNLQYNILYNGVMWRYDPHGQIWLVLDIVR